MPAATTIWFGLDKGKKWHDWVRVVNISNKMAKILAIVRDSQGRTVWSGEKNLNPYQPWVIPAEQSGADRGGDMSLEVRSDGPIAGERHLHHGTDSMAFPAHRLEGERLVEGFFFLSFIQVVMTGCASSTSAILWP